MHRRGAALVLTVAAALLAAPLPPDASVGATAPSVTQQAPALAVRVPALAEPGAVPPAVVASDADLTGVTYAVTDGTAVVGGGVLTPLAAPAGPWSHAATADLAMIGTPGVYRVRVGDLTSAPIDVGDRRYHEVLASTLAVFDANADGAEPSSRHDPSHLNDARSHIANGPHRGERVDVAGGWMDAGDQLKFTVTTAYATLLLELAAANQPLGRRRIADTAAVGVRWLLSAHPRRGVFVAQVGHTDADHNAGFRDPTADDVSSDPRRRVRPSSVLTGRTGGADVAAAAAAALATAALHNGPRRHDRLVASARAWLGEAERLASVWRNCCYQQDSWRDDVAVARAALWRATGRRAYADAALAALRRATGNGERSWLVGADGYEMSGIAAANLCGVLVGPPARDAVRRPACRILRAGGTAWVDQVDTATAFGRAGWAQWASVRQSESGALVLELARRAGLGPAGDASARATGWFLGVNPWGLRWQASARGVRHPYHWVQALGLDLPGAVVGGPAPLAEINANRQVPIALGPYDTPSQTYRDLGDDYVMNEVGIGYSAPAALHFALISPD